MILIVFNNPIMLFTTWSIIAPKKRIFTKNAFLKVLNLLMCNENGFKWVQAKDIRALMELLLGEIVVSLANSARSIH
ncbi:MAG: hypothetical protein ACP6IY_16650 [Promethearchaeia archaeon]